jgi:peroxiredoxin (alkyl hydroperoxide reductase subunit C)
MSLVGQPAPGFTQLPSTKNATKLDEPVALRDYAGRWLVLVFYPADFSTVAPSELLAFSRHAPDFAEYGAELLAISTDGVFCHQAFLEFVLGRVNFPLASDTTLAVSRAYGVLAEDEGVAQPALFLIDPPARPIGVPGSRGCSPPSERIAVPVPATRAVAAE